MGLLKSSKEKLSPEMQVVLLVREKSGRQRLILPAQAFGQQAQSQPRRLQRTPRRGPAAGLTLLCYSPQRRLLNHGSLCVVVVFACPCPAAFILHRSLAHRKPKSMKPLTGTTPVRRAARARPAFVFHEPPRAALKSPGGGPKGLSVACSV